MDCTSCSSVKVCKVFTDIPVSPCLKNRVRQRLFSMVNRIDGYDPDPEESHKSEVASHTSCDSDSMMKIPKSEYIMPKSEISQNATWRTLKDSESDCKNRLRPIFRFDDNPCEQKIHKVDDSTLSSCMNLDDTSTSFNICDAFFTKQTHKETKDFLNIGHELDLTSIIQNFKKKVKNVCEIITSLTWKIHMLERERLMTNIKHEKEMAILKLLHETKMEFVGEKDENKIIERKVILNLLEEVKELLRKSNAFMPQEKFLGTKGQKGRNPHSPSEVEQKLIVVEKKNAALRAETMRLTFEIEQLKKQMPRSNGNKSYPEAVVQKDGPVLDRVEDVEAYYHCVMKEHQSYMLAQISEYKKAIRYLRKRYRKSKK